MALGHAEKDETVKEADIMPLGDAGHGAVTVPERASFWFRRFLAFVGPGYMVAVGYMDPGNWATDLQGGAQFGYRLLSVILLANIMAVLLQALAARLGIITGKDLAQACRDWLPRGLSLPLWLTCELAIIACDLAEVIRRAARGSGSACWGGVERLSAFISGLYQSGHALCGYWHYRGNCHAP